MLNGFQTREAILDLLLWGFVLSYGLTWHTKSIHCIHAYIYIYKEKCINVNVSYYGPSLTLSPTSNVVFKLGRPLHGLLRLQMGSGLHLDYKVFNFMENSILIKLKLYNKIKGTNAIFKIYNPL